MINLFKRPFLLHNSIQHYSWGSRNQDAYIPKLLEIVPEPDTPYAELWMGAHTSAPSKIEVEGEILPLNELIHRFPELFLGPAVASRFKNTLPFLFKVLSAAEALSIQTHPSKGQALLLHKTNPVHYPDDNHKPEIAIALDSLTAFVGFSSYSSIRKNIDKYPEIARFFGLEALADLFPTTKLTRTRQYEKIRELYLTFIHLTQTKTELYKYYVSELAKRLAQKIHRISFRERLFLESFEKYNSNDAGLFSIFFLRIVKLKSGEAICMNTGLPHAYLKGNIIECMANSDNVVRAGLTPKYQDIPTLITILDYSPNSVKIVKPDYSQQEIQYPVFTPEFKISRMNRITGYRELSTKNKIEMLLVLEGNGAIEWDSPTKKIPIKTGQSFIIPAVLGKYKIRPEIPLTLFRVQVP